MGQSAIAIFWGIKQPEVNLYGEDGGGPIEQFEDLHGWDEAPQSPYEAEPPLIGFYVAISGSGRKGAATITGCPVAEVEQVYAETLAVARARWTRFAEWLAAEHGLTFEAPQLWITWAETA
jgi:hypothetical protein